MKKNTLIISVILVMTGLLIWSSGCKKDEGPSPDYLIQIDSIVFADTISLSDTLSVKFYGVVGPNSCYSFNKFEKVELGGSDPANSLKLKVMGKHEDTGNCGDQIVYLDGAEILIDGFAKGNFHILVVQPDETIMVGSGYVEE